MDAIVVGCLVGGFFFVAISHELGHFLTALAFGVRGKEIGIGFRIPGTQILSISRRILGIKFSLNPILLGAFATIPNEEIKKISDSKKIAIYLAGSLVNIFLGIVTIVIIKKSVIVGIESIISTIHSFWIMISGGGSSIDMLVNVTAGTETSSLLIGITAVSMLGIILGILNLAPLPILDGGRIFFIISERIFGKEKSELLYMAMLAVAIIVLWSF